MKSPKTNCADVRQNLYLFLGGELETVSLREDTEQHLSQCAACREELEGARRSRELYLTAAVDTDSEELDLWPGIRSRLYSEQLLVPRNVSSPSSPFETATPSRLRRLAPVAAIFATAAAFLIALPFLKQTVETPEVRDRPPIVAQPAGTHSPTLDLPSSADESLVAGEGARLRPVLRGDESLIERERRLLEEQLLNPAPGAGETPTHPFESSIYDVVNQRRLR